jgi:hypothetical protein
MTRKSMTLALCFSLATLTFSSAAFAQGRSGSRGGGGQSGNGRMTFPSRGEAQRGDDRGGFNRRPELGGDRGGVNKHPEPGDDRGGVNKHPEPGDDRGRGGKHLEPGDDHSRSNR